MFFVNKIRRKLPSPNPAKPTPAESALINQLRQQIAELPELDLSEDASAAEKRWSTFRAEIRTQLLKNDPREFLQFDVFRRTMFVDHPPYIARELEELRRRADWRSRWKPAIEESDKVFVPRCPYYWKSSGNLIHQAFHLAGLEHQTGMSLERLQSVFEFGGGYGAMCKLFNRLGFAGTYSIFDLPELSILQRFFLGLHGIPVRSVADSIGMNVHCISDLAEICNQDSEVAVDLFLATWSLSETPIEFRRKLLAKVNARFVLIAYQEMFEDIDNARFFKQMMAANPDWKWQNVHSPHLPGNEYYLVGVRQTAAKERGIVDK